MAQGVSILAGIASTYAFWPRIAGEIDPRTLRDRYLAKEGMETRVAIFATRVFLYEQDESRLKEKLERMKLAMILLIMAVVLVVAGSIVDVVKGDQDGRASITDATPRSIGGKARLSLAP